MSAPTFRALVLEALVEIHGHVSGALTTGTNKAEERKSANI